MLLGAHFLFVLTHSQGFVFEDPSLFLQVNNFAFNVAIRTEEPLIPKSLTVLHQFFFTYNLVNCPGVLHFCVLIRQASGTAGNAFFITYAYLLEQFFLLV